jgi:hypothetical protein
MDETSDFEPTLVLDLPRAMSRLEGGPVEKITLREPQLRHFLVSEKEVETQLTPHTIRARDVKLLSMVSKLRETEIRQLPVSTLNHATTFLRGFTEIEAEEKPAEQPDSLSIALDPPLRAPNGEEYDRIVLQEPNTGDVEAAERVLKKGLNLYSLRLYQQTLLNRASNIPSTAVPFLPISKVDEACRYLQGFIDPGPATTRS